MKIYSENNKLILLMDGMKLLIIPWGENGLRVMMQAVGIEDNRNWALSEKIPVIAADIEVKECDLRAPWEDECLISQRGTIRNGKISAEIDGEGHLCFKDEKGNILLEEYWRDRKRINRYAVPIKTQARDFKAVMGTTEYKLTMRFEAQENEKIFGMGQYQDSFLNKKGEILELEHRNTQSSIPFYISNRGYGFLWNNPAIGKVVFGKNKTEWIAERTKKLDYYITAADTPSIILQQFTQVVGRAPLMPEFIYGLWQCKLRYRSQAEVISVVEEHKKRGIPLKVIVIDFFHWTKQGEFRFDPKDWPDPMSMVQKLRDNGVEVMVSVWPTVDGKAEDYKEMEDKGYLVKNDRGLQIHMNFMGEARFWDPFTKDSREFVWNLCRKNYYSKGIRLFWLDEAEPEYGPYEFDLYRYQEGPAYEVSNFYPVQYAKTFWEGMKGEGQSKIVNLIRTAWAGSQKYGVLVWSGDVHSSFRALKEQIQAGISMGLAGIPWWTTDIGGFLGGYSKDGSFIELLIRWFEWAVFCPVLRMHGQRQPFEKLEEEFRNGIKQFTSGQPNEIYSYGREAFEIMNKYLKIRISLKEYLEKLMFETHETGLPIMRALFLHYPEDIKAWEIEDEYLFGKDFLVAPISEEGQRNKKVYFPGNETWISIFDKKEYKGGNYYLVDASLDKIPVFVKNDVKFEINL